MAYESGEEKLRSVETSRARIDEVHTAVKAFLGLGWGSHRFSSHGYVSVSKGDCKEFADLEDLRNRFIDFEFKLSSNNEGQPSWTVHYRTKGSTGWR